MPPLADAPSYSPVPGQPVPDHQNGHLSDAPVHVQSGYDVQPPTAVPPTSVSAPQPVWPAVHAAHPAGKQLDGLDELIAAANGNASPQFAPVTVPFDGMASAPANRAMPPVQPGAYESALPYSPANAALDPPSTYSEPQVFTADTGFGHIANGTYDAPRDPVADLPPFAPVAPAAPPPQSGRPDIPQTRPDLSHLPPAIAQSLARLQRSSKTGSGS